MYIVACVCVLLVYMYIYVHNAYVYNTYVCICLCILYNISDNTGICVERYKPSTDRLAAQAH